MMMRNDVLTIKVRLVSRVWVGYEFGTRCVTFGSRLVLLWLEWSSTETISLDVTSLTRLGVSNIFVCPIIHDSWCLVIGN